MDHTADRLFAALASLRPGALWAFTPTPESPTRTYESITWTDPRPKPTMAELLTEADRLESAAAARVTNEATIRQRTAAALDQNRTIAAGADTYLAGHITLGANPTTAQTVAAVKAYGVQLRALTIATQWAAQQRNGLIRLTLDDLAGTD